MNHIKTHSLQQMIKSIQNPPKVLQSHTCEFILWAGIFAVSIHTGLTVAAPPSSSQLPTGGNVAVGSASINSSGSSININQASNRVAINWNTFDIGANATVNFIQPNANAVALNRVNSSNPSQIFGNLNANGQVYLLNSAGVYFAPGASVNVGGIVATTKSMDDASFMQGSTSFGRDKSSGSVINDGSIKTKINGFIALLAPEVQNNGVLIAQAGTVILSGGKEAMTLNFGAFSTLESLTVKPSLIKDLLKNRYAVQGPSGMIVLSAHAITQLTGSVINSGVIEANGVTQSGGRVILQASRSIIDSGTISANGALAGIGDGGNISIISNLGNLSSQTTITGSISALGGELGGNGGKIETSGSKVEIGPHALINTSAAKGTFGTWIIDPSDFTIAPTGGDITGTLLSNNLLSTNVSILSTQGTSGSAGNIYVNDAINWSSNSALTLIAQNNIIINSQVTALGNSAQLNLQYGQAAIAVGNSSQYTVNAPINLQSGNNFSTKLGSDGSTIQYTVLNTLGLPNSITGSDLQGINANPNGNFALGSSINALVTADWNNGAGFTPLGSAAAPFTGNFDGLGHTISNLNIHRPLVANIGFFGLTSGPVQIQNIGIVTSQVIGAVGTGGLIGSSDAAIVNNSYFTGMVEGAAGTGGLIGVNSLGSISNSYAQADVIGAAGTGGVVGSMTTGSFFNGYHLGNVTGDAGTGGVIGSITTGSVTNAFAVGNVIGVAGTGGVVGSMTTGSFNHGYSKGTVLGGAGTGGIVGSMTTGNVNSAFSASDVTGAAGTGGLVGTMTTGGIDNGYSLIPLVVTITANNLSQVFNATAFQGGAGVTYTSGFNQNLVFSSSTSGNVTGAAGTGGLVGTITSGNINNAIATGSVSGAAGTGGLVGTITSGSINNGFATGNVTGAAGTGGLVGTITSGSISNSFATGNIDAQGAAGAGGLAGNSSGMILKSYATGSVTNGAAGTSSFVGAGAFKPLNSFSTGSANGIPINNSVSSAQLISIWNASHIVPLPIGVLGYSGTSQQAANVGSYTMTPMLSGANPNYDYIFVNGLLSITPLSVNVTGTYAKNTIYNNTNIASLSGGILNSGLKGAFAGGVVLNQSGIYASANVGTQMITATDTLTGVNAGNYLLIQPTGLTGIITPKAVTVANTNTNSTVYNNTTVANLSGGTLMGVLDGGVTLNQSGMYAKANVGKQLITATDTLSGPNAANYTLIEPVGLSAIITPLGVTVENTIANNTVYNNTKVANLSDGTLVGVLAGGVTLNQSGKYSSANAGLQIITATDTLTGVNATNYFLIQPTGLSAMITPLAVTVANTVANNTVYNNTTVANLSGGSLVGILTSGVTLSQSGTYAGSNVGKQTITVTDTLTGINAANYTLIEPTGLSAMITPLGLKVTNTIANSTVYNTTTVANLSGGTLMGVLDGGVTLNQSGTYASANAGKQLIVATDTLSGVNAANYTLIEPVGLSAMITPLGVTVANTIAQSTVYNNTKVANLSGGTLIGILAGGVTLNQSGAYASANAGMQTITATDTLAGVNASNYILIQPTGLSAMITPLGVTVANTIANNTVYNNTTVANLSGGTLVGILAGGVTLVQSGYYLGADAGKQNIVATDTLKGVNAANYTLIEPTGLSALITPKLVTVTNTIANSTIANSTTVANLSGGRLTGILAGGVTLNQSGNYSSANVGIQTITATDTLSGINAANYTLIQPTGLKAMIKN
jgi:filamentous hemagglutinin family protein